MLTISDIYRKPGEEGGGVTSLKEANVNVPLDGVAFSRLDWLSWGRISIELLEWAALVWIFGVRKFFILMVSKGTRMFVL